jgi:hypothetical protein
VAYSDYFLVPCFVAHVCHWLCLCQLGAWLIGSIVYVHICCFKLFFFSFIVLHWVLLFSYVTFNFFLIFVCTLSSTISCFSGL